MHYSEIDFDSETFEPTNDVSDHCVIAAIRDTKIVKGDILYHQV
jgi:hypothetical protein